MGRSDPRSASISADRASLIPRELERQRCQPAPEGARRARRGGCPGGLPRVRGGARRARPGAGRAPRRPAGRGPLGLVEARGEVRRRPARRRRRPAGGAPEARPAAARARDGRAACACQAQSRMRCARSRSEAGCTGTMPGRVDARVGAVALPAELVRLHPEPRAVELSVQQHPRPLAQPLGEPRLVEPHRLRRPRCVRHRRLDDRQPAPAGRPQPGRAHLHQYRRLLAQPQLPKRPRLGSLAVGVREPTPAGPPASRCPAPPPPPRAGDRRREAWSPRHGAGSGGARSEAAPRQAARGPGAPWSRTRPGRRAPPRLGSREEGPPHRSSPQGYGGARPEPVRLARRLRPAPRPAPGRSPARSA